MGFFPFFPQTLPLSGGTISGPLTVTGLLTTQAGITNSGAAVQSSAGMSTSGLTGFTSGGNITANIGGISGLAFTSVASAPGMAAGANAGTGPPAPVVGASSGNSGGSGTFGTGTTPAAGAMVAVTYATAYGGAVSFPVVVAGNTAAQALGLYVSAATQTGFTVSCTTAPAASQANTTYAFTYVVLG